MRGEEIRPNARAPLRAGARSASPPLSPNPPQTFAFVLQKPRCEPAGWHTNTPKTIRTGREEVSPSRQRGPSLSSPQPRSSAASPHGGDAEHVGAGGLRCLRSTL